MTIVDDILKKHGELVHYGTKGMKWGVRKDTSSSSKPSSSKPSASSKKSILPPKDSMRWKHNQAKALIPKSKDDPRWKHNQVKALPSQVKTVAKKVTPEKKVKPASSDAKKAAELRTKAKTKGSKSLSNEEMSTLIKRMQLDSQYSQLSAKQKNKGLQKAQQILENVGTQLVTQEIKTGGKGTRALVSAGKNKYSQALFESVLEDMV